MTSVNDTPPPLPPDPLARHRVITSGPHVVRILLVATVVMGLGLVAYMLGRSQGAGGLPKLSVALGPTQPEPRLPSYEDMAPKPLPPPAPRIEKREPAPPPPRPQAKAASKEDELRKKAMEAGVGGWSRKEEGKNGEGGLAASDFVSVDGACVVPSGTPIPAQTITRVVSEHGGIVTAMVTRDVWDAGFSCLAVPAGSMLSMAYTPAMSRGQKRIDIANPVITRPWPKNDTVTVAAMIADTTGASGLPGNVEVPWFRTGLLIAASTAVDLTTAALTGGGSLLGAMLGRNLDSPLDKVTKDLLDRAPVITLEAGEPITVILRGALRADDARGG
ncbi:conjugal transfer protein TrbI [Azospirillum humicireducens]|uniref:Conjugal transfer protein TrbI n=1 Tax=Azospirillum humicireducens TaxID=1226968 RepID=A0A160JEB8_9PROT|nr:TrbI/VirB10 family protein [Azospirillum humicireducens]ANC91120.1 conjugal transfer protein TrbI [Azospirillum humicireducens]